MMIQNVTQKLTAAVLGCIAMLGMAGLSSGEDQPANASPSATGQEVSALIDQLNDERFVKREQATQDLAKLGQQAVPALGKAAADERPEVSQRAFKILAAIHNKGDAASQAAAKKKLSELAKSENTGVAKSAQDILDRQTEEPAETLPARRPGIIFPGGRFGGGRFGGGRIIGGGIRLGGGGGLRRMRVVSDAGGDKEIEVTEGGRTVKITENATDGITVEMTETKDGKTITKEYKAADAKELKKKHPEGHKLYEQYSGDEGRVLGGGILGGGGPGGIRIEFGEGGIGGALPEDVRKRIAEEIKRALPEGTLPADDLGEELKKAETELRKLLKDGALPAGGIPPEFKKMIKEFEKRAAPPKADGSKAETKAAPTPKTLTPKTAGTTTDDDLDAAIERLRKSLKESKDEKKMLAVLKRLERLQAEQLERLKARQAEIEKKLKEAE
jgi:hypothetical protein